MKLLFIILIVGSIIIGLIMLILYLHYKKNTTNYRYCVPDGHGIDCSKPCHAENCDNGLCVDFPTDPCNISEII